uniref:Peptidase M14 domain-containing protein n=1 Tax=Glossina brevipalpis TaxID=37001 RepID=A0A1A9WVJ3_9MUSC
MLKILLANLSGLTRSERYEYTYYPSAEEFDQPSHLTWTSNFNKRHRYPENFKTTYQPKFLYNKERKEYSKDSNVSKSMKKLNVNAEQNIINAKIDFLIKGKQEPLKENIIENKKKFPVYFSKPNDNKIFTLNEILNKNEYPFQVINQALPILITKEQYDHDLLLLKQTLLKKCQETSNVKPSIIRLSKPVDVIVKSQLTVNDNMAIKNDLRWPLIKRKESLNKIRKNLKKFKPPGRKPLKPTNFLNLKINNSTIPPIKTASETNKLSTQLEKPNIDSLVMSTVYSQTPLTSIKGYMTLTHQDISDKLNFQHHIKKRFVNEKTKSLTNDQLITKISKMNISKRKKNLHLNDEKKDLNKKCKEFCRKLHNSAQDQFKLNLNRSLENENVKKYCKNYFKTNQAKLSIDSIYKKMKNQTQHNLISKYPDDIQVWDVEKHPESSSHLKLMKRSIDDKETFFKNRIPLESPENQTLNVTRNASEYSLKQKKLKKNFKRKIDDHYKFERLGNRSDGITIVRSKKFYKKLPFKNHNNQLAPEYTESDESNESDDYYKNDDDETYHEEYEENKISNYYNENNEYSIEDSHTTSTVIKDYTESIEDVNATNSQIAKPPYSEHIVSPTRINTKSPSTIKKRIRRRPARGDYYDDDDDEEDDDFPGTSLTSNVSGFLRLLFYPVQMVMSSILDNMSPKRTKDNTGSSSHYISYHNTLKQQSNDDYYDEDSDYGDDEDNDDNSFGNWFSSWFTFNRRNKKIGSTTTAPNRRKPSKTSNSWLPSWLKFGGSKSEDDYDDYEKWFSSWFGDTKIKGNRRRPTTTTSTTTQLPQVPILTIVDPMRNPQNWIGILTNHILNNATTTHNNNNNPMMDTYNRITSTTTEDPEIPHKITYDKYQIWRLKPQDDSQVRVLEEYRRSDEGIKLQWLKGPSLRGLTDVLVPPRMLVNFQGSLTFESIDHEVLIFDVGKAIAYEKTKENSYHSQGIKNLKKHITKNPPMASMSWRKYYGYEDIIKYTENMHARYPQLVELLHIGRSYEGRPLVVIKIESKEVAAANSAAEQSLQKTKLSHKKRTGIANAVFIEAGTHGLEWIGPATATWIINELLKIMKSNSKYVYLNFHFLQTCAKTANNTLDPLQRY